MTIDSFNRIKNLGIFKDTNVQYEKTVELMAAASLFECAKSFLYTLSLNGLPYGLNQEIMGNTKMPLCTKTIGTVMLFAFESYSPNNKYKFIPVYGINTPKSSTMFDVLISNLRYHMNSSYKQGYWNETPIHKYEDFKKFHITAEIKNFILTVCFCFINDESSWSEDDVYSLEKEAEKTWNEMTEEEKKEFVLNFDTLPTNIQELYVSAYENHKSEYKK